jgi:hypothetical protein
VWDQGLYRQDRTLVARPSVREILRIAPEVRRRRKPERGVIEATVARGVILRKPSGVGIFAGGEVRSKRAARQPR